MLYVQNLFPIDIYVHYYIILKNLHIATYITFTDKSYLDKDNDVYEWKPK